MKSESGVELTIFELCWLDVVGVEQHINVLNSHQYRAEAPLLAPANVSVEFDTLFPRRRPKKGTLRVSTWKELNSNVIATRHRPRPNHS